ncbi:DUF4055 domain-containing protein [Alphaproteobacteria bacterium LSUCC0719]
MHDDSIAAPGLAHRAMAPELDLIADLMGGTAAMRRGGQRWLPREANESWTAWRARLHRSVLFNGMARTVLALAGRPFARPVTLADANPALSALASSVDGSGMAIGGFAAMVLRALLTDGLVHILVDRPRKGGAPYFVLVPAAQLIGARRDADGLADIRIREGHARTIGRFGEEAVEAVRFISRRDWSLWQSGRRGWHVSEQGQHDFGEVPLITLNAAPTGFMRARPPLIDLAWLNLAHWQSASDQRHILHVARVPVLFGRALQVADGEIEIGPNRLILADDPAADLRFVEHSGAAIAAGRQDLIDLEDRMAVLGLDMLRHRPGETTATGRAIDAAQTHAALNGIVQTLEDGLGRAFRLAARLLGYDAGAAGRIVISRQFPVRDDQAAEADLLLRARLAGEISSQAFLAEIARRGILGGAGTPTAQTSPPSAQQEGTT